jgi:hypothetical protein
MRRRALLFGLLAAGCRKVDTAPPTVWFSDVGLAYVEARRIERPLFLSFGATWDTASKELEHKTYRDPLVATLLFTKFVCAYVDCSDDESPTTMDLLRRFDVKGTPTLLVTDPFGVHLWGASEYMPPEKLAAVLRRVAGVVRCPDGPSIVRSAAGSLFERDERSRHERCRIRLRA